jgi:tetratricopeptide (TPR) repeat protein
MSFVNPHIAAAYLLSRERKRCGNLDDGNLPGTTELAREEIRLKNRRDHCAFERTQGLIAGLLDRGRADHGDWAPYIFGQIHMARAAAVPRMSDQLSELDQAIGKFAELQLRRPDSVSALTTLVEAHVRKAVVIHQRTAAMQWSDDSTSPLQRQLFLAEQTFSDAEMQLRRIPSQRSAALAGIVSRIEGYLAYRRWMLMAHRRTKSGVIAMATGQSVELEMLGDAENRYRLAETNGVSAAAFYIEWGNILRAMGRFDEAAARYSRAAERDPTDITSRLNITINYLDRVIHGPAPSDPLFLLIALGATSDYLAWASLGGPYFSLKAQIAHALARSDDGDDPRAFSACLEFAAAAPPSDSASSRWRVAAELKHCVDQAIDGIDKRLRLTAAPAGAAKTSR